MNFSFINIPYVTDYGFEFYFAAFFIAIPAYFVFKWLFKKVLKNNKTRIVTTWIATLITIPITCFGLFVLLIFYITYTPTRDFNKAKWQTNKEKRFEMADDLIKSNMLIGKDTTQLKLTLGAPTWRDTTKQQWVYDMGTGSKGFGVAFHHLIISITNNTAIAVKHTEVDD